jgi:hypothetical protein
VCTSTTPTQRSQDVIDQRGHMTFRSWLVGDEASIEGWRGQQVDRQVHVG